MRSRLLTFQRFTSSARDKPLVTLSEGGIGLTSMQPRSIGWRTRTPELATSLFPVLPCREGVTQHSDKRREPPRRTRANVLTYQHHVTGKRREHRAAAPLAFPP